MIAAFVLAAASATMSPQPSPSPSPVPANAAVIVNSGSTNARGYRIVVTPDKHAVVTIDGLPPRAQTLDAATSTALFKALAAGAPLDALESEPCMKSASFGSTTTVTYDGKRSPDLSCPMEGAGAKVGAAVQKVTEALHVLAPGRTLRRTMSQPQQPEPEATT
jgi:hypothetical protein